MKLDEVELRSQSFDRFLFLLYVHFYSFTAAGIWDEIKVNELPDWDWAWSDGTKAANWGLRKGSLRVFVFVFCFFAVIHPTFKHAPWKESTIKRSVDDLELFNDQPRKIFFASAIWSLMMLLNGQTINTICYRFILMVAAAAKRWNIKLLPYPVSKTARTSLPWSNAPTPWRCFLT